jgi:hypothetical protein
MSQLECSEVSKVSANISVAIITLQNPCINIMRKCVSFGKPCSHPEDANSSVCRNVEKVLTSDAAGARKAKVNVQPVGIDPSARTREGHAFRDFI